MATDKFDKSKVGLEAGQFSQIKLDDDGNITLEQGVSSGTFVTPVYHSDGSATKVSWTSSETSGEINLLPGITPKQIEMRASNTAPTVSNVVVDGATFDPDISYGFSQIGDNWTVSITGIKQVDNVYAGGLWRVSFGAPIIRNASDNVYLGPGGAIVTAIGQAYTNINYDYINTGGLWRISFGQPITFNNTENLTVPQGAWNIGYSGGVIAS